MGANDELIENLTYDELQPGQKGADAAHADHE
jgi:hypothetical protein